jgi:DNA-binding transcriptional MerR regulator
MELIPIGEAAERLGVRTSALRYYDERGLVEPAAREHGKRVYGRQELRHLAFLQIAQRLGIPLDTAAAVLDEASDQWRKTVGDQITQLDELIARAQGAKDFLTHALMCPAEHPARECPHLLETLDRLLGGGSFEELATEYRRTSDDTTRPSADRQSRDANADGPRREDQIRPVIPPSHD